ncbi:MAG: hypothetical protein HDR20_11435 [Lachnospiraceae bacterium]|nr:hypothetical protein [Lachnospiraceae bacterium]
MEETNAIFLSDGRKVVLEEDDDIDLSLVFPTFPVKMKKRFHCLKLKTNN